jgi:hypothetical protein
VRSTDNSFTAPTQGTTYSSGDSLGGDTVVYRGGGTNFSDTGLGASTTYYYRLYAENWSYYSPGANTSATTTTTPTPTPTPTPKQTPKAIETLAAHYVDPFIHGERWEGQWFKWNRFDVQGLKDLSIGIIIYRHAWLDSFTWWDYTSANYQTQKPKEGFRYLVVWVHEEMFGNTTENDPSFWVFDESAFRVQVKGTLYSADTSNNPVNHIKELENYFDFYNAEITKPFTYLIRYSRNDFSDAGVIAERVPVLRMGPGNAADGYILFQVPKNTMEEDVMILGGFSRFGNAYWRITR